MKIIPLIFLSLGIYLPIHSSDNEVSTSEIITISIDPVEKSKKMDDISTLWKCNEEEIAGTVLNCFFQGNNVEVNGLLKPYVCRHIKQRKRLSAIKALKSLTVARKSLDESADTELTEELKSFIAEVMADALDEACEEKEHYRLESNRRVTRPRVAVITTVGAFLSACITAGVTLAIHFSACSQ